MAATGAVRITSISGALTVTLTTASGRTPTVYTDRALTTTTALPATVADGTTSTFYVATPGPYTISVKNAAGTELAGPTNTTRTVDLTAGQVAAFSYDTRIVTPVTGDTGSSSDPSTNDSAAYAAGVPAGLRVTLGSTQPASPLAADLWLSTSASKIRIPAGQADRSIVLTADQTWEGTVVQEPNVWYDPVAALWKMIYTGNYTSAALGYATATNPLGPWTKHGKILGEGAGGEAGAVGHSNVYIEGTTGYIYYPSALGGGTLKVATFAVSDPTTITLVGNVLAPAGTALGIVNSSLIKRGTNDYVMLFESSVSNPEQWRTGYATATSPTGTFTIGTFPLPTLQHSTGAYGGPCLTKEGSSYVNIYHACPIANTNVPTLIYRATSADLVTWTQDAGVMVRRVATVEHDQVADPSLAYSQNGSPYLFWSAMDNTAPAGHIMASPASASVQQYDGGQWATLLAPSDQTATGPTLITAVVTGGDFSTATTGVNTDIPGLTFTYTPDRDEYGEITCRIAAYATSTGILSPQMVVTPAPAIGTATVGAENDSAAGGALFPFLMTQKVKLQAGVTYTIKAQIYHSAGTANVSSVAANTKLEYLGFPIGY